MLQNLRFLLPAALAIGLLMVLQAQNDQADPPPADTSAPPEAPAPAVPQPRTVVPPPATPSAPFTPDPEGNPANTPATVAPAPVPPPQPVIENPASTPGGESPTTAAPVAPVVTAPAAPVIGTTAPAPTFPAVVTAGQSATTTVSTADEIPSWEFNEPTMDIHLILDKYQELTGHHTIRDVALQGMALPLRSNGKMTRQQAIDFIKAYLLLNGVAIVPSEVRNTDKVLPVAKSPTLEQRSEARAVYTDPAELPESEEIVNYVMYFKNISADEALRSMQQAFQGRPNAKLIAVAQAGALIITDNVPAIHFAVALQPKIDVPLAAVEKKFFQLERADAEDVAQVITDILSAQSKLRQQQSGATGRAISVNAAAQQMALPPGAVATVASAPGQEAGGAQPPDESTVIVKAITRTNEVLVTGRPSDIEYIGDLIQELDKEATVKNLHSFQLRFIRVEDFLGVAEQAISRGQEIIQSSGGGGAVGGGGAGPTARGFNQNPGGGFTGSPEFGGGRTFTSNQTGARTGARGGVGGGFAGGGGGSRSSRGGSASTATGQLAPTSTVVGKTLLIAEPRMNMLLVSGPPEHIKRIEEVIREMDRRPWQVSIAAVVAEVTLGDDLEYGFDILRKMEVVGDDRLAGSFRGLSSGTGIIDPNVLLSVDDFRQAGVLATGGLNIYGAFGEFFNAYIRALENTGRTKVLARPFIFTANNKPAQISIGERVPVPSATQSSVVAGGTTSLNTSIEYQDVNLVLDVVPLINSKGEVTLTISQENNDILEFVDIGTERAPRISQQFLDTEIALPNGGIAVIGGLIRERENVNNNSVPIIGKIPLLRNLFGSTTHNQSRRELLIFIQPRIVETSDELVAMHADHIRRTVTGREAEEFAHAPYNVDGVVLPLPGGEVPLSQAHSLLPQQVTTTTETVATAPLDPKQPVSAPTDLAPAPFQPEPDLAPREVRYNRAELPAEKRRQPFWEKPAPPQPKPSSGLKKLLPWNWGK